MSDHDLIRVTSVIGGHTVTCRCGWEDTHPTDLQARDAHARHFTLAVHLPAARTALEGGQ